MSRDHRHRDPVWTRGQFALQNKEFPTCRTIEQSNRRTLFIPVGLLQLRSALLGSSAISTTGRSSSPPSPKPGESAPATLMGQGSMSPWRNSTARRSPSTTGMPSAASSPSPMPPASPSASTTTRASACPRKPGPTASPSVSPAESGIREYSRTTGVGSSAHAVDPRRPCRVCSLRKNVAGRRKVRAILSIGSG